MTINIISKLDPFSIFIEKGDSEVEGSPDARARTYALTCEARPVQSVRAWEDASSASEA